MADNPTSSDPGPETPDAPDASGPTESPDTPDAPDPSDLPSGPDLTHAEERSDAAEEASEPPAQPLVRWPPPGLERLQGDLWTVVDRLGMGGAIFALPLLAAMTLSLDPWRTGIFGDAWWIVLFTSVVGLWILLAGYVGLFRALRRWRSAAERGYARRTVALVLADRPGDTGFLVQGGRAYSVLDASRRNGLLRGRLMQVTLLLSAGLWLSAGFVAGVMLSARSVLTETGLTVWTLAPIGAAGVVVIVLKAWENSVLRRARKKWFAQSWTEDLTRDEIQEWHEGVGARRGAVPMPVGRTDGRGSGSLSAAAVLTGVVAVLVVLLAVPLVTMTGVGPILADVATPSFSRTAEKFARTEALEPLVLPVDPEITAQQAGDALYAMTSRTGSSPAKFMKEPPRSYDAVFPGGEYSDNPTGLAAHMWAQDLMPQARSLDAEVVAWLEEVGSHPALAELRTLAQAGSLDEAGALYDLPFPDDLISYQVPIPKFSGFRSLAYAQVGGAVADVARGRVDAAETKLRELISAGSLMGREGQTLLTSLIGIVTAGVGAEALANLYGVTGRPEAEEALRSRRALAERAADVGSLSLGRRQLSEMPELVTDTSAIRGMRWEHLHVLSGMGPCLNLNRVVFGPPEGYDEWIAEVRETLVRFESEEHLLSTMLRGWGTAESESPAGRLFAQVMGGGAGSCAGLLEVAM